MPKTPALGKDVFRKEPYIWLYLILSKPHREARVSCKSVLQSCQFLPKERQRKKPLSEEDIGSQTPIVGVHCGVDGDTANDDSPERHEFQNVIKHPLYLLSHCIGTKRSSRPVTLDARIRTVSTPRPLHSRTSEPILNKPRAASSE